MQRVKTLVTTHRFSRLGQKGAAFSLRSNVTNAHPLRIILFLSSGYFSAMVDTPWEYLTPCVLQLEVLLSILLPHRSGVKQAVVNKEACLHGRPDKYTFSLTDRPQNYFFQAPSVMPTKDRKCQ